MKLDTIQAWIDAKPTDPNYLTLAIRCMTDHLPVSNLRELTTWCLAVERRKADESRPAGEVKG